LLLWISATAEEKFMNLNAIIPPIFSQKPSGKSMRLIAAAGIATTLWITHIRRRIGGYTGDCLGAAQQLAEIGFYLGVVAMSH